MLCLYCRPHLSAPPGLCGWPLVRYFLWWILWLTCLKSLSCVDWCHWCTLINSLPHFGDSSVDTITHWHITTHNCPGPEKEVQLAQQPLTLTLYKHYCSRLLSQFTCGGHPMLAFQCVNFIKITNKSDISTRVLYYRSEMFRWTHEC